MKAFKNITELKEYRKAIIDSYNNNKPCIVICGGTGGQASGANDLIRIIKHEILVKKLHDKISLRITGCLGFCEMDPFIIIEPGYNLYPKLKMDDVPKIINAAINGTIVEELLYKEPGSSTKRFTKQEIPFFKGQARKILDQNQFIDPMRITDYIKTGGYQAIEKVLEKPDPDWIIKEILKSKLRGRGGAGFFTGKSLTPPMT